MRTSQSTADIVHSRDAETALGNCRQDKKIMGDTNAKFLDMLNLLIGQTTKNLEKMERKKYETLITVHMHQRDVFEAMVKSNIKHSQDFEWLKQARLITVVDRKVALPGSTSKWSLNR